jgi:hypothetical protein
VQSRRGPSAGNTHSRQPQSKICVSLQPALASFEESPVHVGPPCAHRPPLPFAFSHEPIPNRSNHSPHSRAPQSTH